jgi:lipopolysaccharide/colanic/teichoic acid biosynthesis glycosyltransferase
MSDPRYTTQDSAGRAPGGAVVTPGSTLLRSLFADLNGPLYRRYGKRLLDLAAAGTGTALISPVLASLAGIVYATSGRPIFFRQERVGRHGEIFRIFKFRTMIPDAVKSGRGFYLEENDPRITKCGGWMRATSLDELPQLFNVILGDMSLVGPRPNLVFIVDKYRSRFDRILAERPGITCLVAVGGRNRLTRSRMIALDDEYVADVTLLGDLKILARTLPAVLLRSGASDDVSEEFMEDVAADPGWVETPDDA